MLAFCFFFINSLFELKIIKTHEICFLCQPITCKTKTGSVARHFPAISISYLCLLQILIAIIAEVTEQPRGTLSENLVN